MLIALRIVGLAGSLAFGLHLLRRGKGGHTDSSEEHQPLLEGRPQQQQQSGSGGGQQAGAPAPPRSGTEEPPTGPIEHEISTLSLDEGTVSTQEMEAVGSDGEECEQASPLGGRQQQEQQQEAARQPSREASSPIDDLPTGAAPQRSTSEAAAAAAAPRDALLAALASPPQEASEEAGPAGTATSSPSAEAAAGPLELPSLEQPEQQQQQQQEELGSPAPAPFFAAAAPEALGRQGQPSAVAAVAAGEPAAAAEAAAAPQPDASRPPHPQQQQQQQQAASAEPSRDSDVSLADGLGESVTQLPLAYSQAWEGGGEEDSWGRELSLTDEAYFPYIGIAGASSAAASSAAASSAPASSGQLLSSLAAEALPASLLEGGDTVEGSVGGALGAAVGDLGAAGSGRPDLSGQADLGECPKPVRLSLSDWVPSSSGSWGPPHQPGGEGSAAQQQQQQQRPLPLGSPLVLEPLSLPEDGAGPASWSPGRGPLAGPPTDRSAAAALADAAQASGAGGSAAAWQQLQQHAGVELSATGTIGASGGRRGSRPPLLQQSGGTHKSLFVELREEMGAGFGYGQPASPELSPSQQWQQQQQQQEGGLMWQPAPTNGAAAAAQQAQQAQRGLPAWDEGSISFLPFQPSEGELPSPRSPFRSPRAAAHSSASLSPMCPQQQQQQQQPFPQFNTFLAERPLASPPPFGGLQEGSSAATVLSAGSGSNVGVPAPNPWAAAGAAPPQQAQQAQQLLGGPGGQLQQAQLSSWADLGLGLGQGRGGEDSAAWSSAEERLASGSSSARGAAPGGEKRLRVNEFGGMWLQPSLASTSRGDEQPRLALKLTVIAGPCAEATYVTQDDTTEVIIGRSPGNTMQLNDAEVSGRHLLIHWNAGEKCWQVADLGSLNGTLLNGEPISQARKRGRDYRLSPDDILQLGSFTKVKVSTFPREMLDPSDRHGSLPVGSLPKSLSVPKHRIPSFTSLLSPKINTTPSKKASVAAASDELRLECGIVSRAGRDHMRKGQVCEDVASAACPLPCGDALPAGTFPSLFCVFDGHCGRAAAEQANTLLPDEVAARLPGHAPALAQAEGVAPLLREAFLAADDRITAEEGCTATAVLAWRDEQGAVCLQAANVGDSAALFLDPATGTCSPITEDHRLSNPRERDRLRSLGIQVTQDTRRLYGLNLARGLGDKFLKDEDLGLSAEPFVSHVVRVPATQGGMLLIASDGLWDFADVDIVAQLVLQTDRDQDGSVLEVADAVIGHAVKQRTRDDVTVLVARIWPEDEWELRSPLRNLDDGASVSFVG